ncbi:DUF4253 domain-containing protein [Paenibacillus sp. N3/727]|uniref:DUF4253 domain-containing protein n=1 Tax=Paenibacillus sp. N3/727 TaxID=2925845 RepID=UPI001F52E46B|nr:DUF4253 domain-containing protein [Paenibacillus sp. N3/727]UNK16343.1 DUF4253 domain-containing protein [Paenibacillus sp. N3/727]
MIEELSDYLQECEIEVVAVENVSLPATKEGKHSIFVLPGYNLVEMMEDTLDEEESPSEYVRHQLEEVHSLSVEDVWRQIVKSQLEYSDLSSEQKNLEGKDFEEIYHSYSLLWDGHDLLSEEQCETETEPFHVTVEWLEENIEEDEELIVLILPQESGYEAPLWIPMGGFNECPFPVHQSVVIKHWQEEHGIKLLAVSDDIWVMQTGKPPQTFEEALKLAKEHFIFCSYVLEGHDSLGDYADYLMKHDVWYFWWD